MAYQLVGAVGAASQGASGAAITPAWGVGQNRALNNLLILWVQSQGSVTLPSAPSGWSVAIQVAGTLCSSSIFYKLAAGADAAPTVALVTSSTLSGTLSEFSGNVTTSPLDQTATAMGTTSPLVATAGAVDFTAGDLLVGTAGGFYSVAGTEASFTNALTNAVAHSANNNGGNSTAFHYVNTYGFTTTKAVADADTFTYTVTSITGASVVMASFKMVPNPLPVQTCSNRSKFPMLRRGRYVNIVPKQQNPPFPFVWREPATRRSRLEARSNTWPKGKRWNAAPPQLNPPYPWPNRIDVARSKFTMLRRGKFVNVVPPQLNPPIVIQRTVRGFKTALIRQARIKVPIISQAEPIWQRPTRIARNLRIGKGKRSEFFSSQIVPPSWPPKFVAPKRLLAAVVRGKRTMSPIAQDRPLRTASAPGKLALRLRSRRIEVVPPQLNPPFVIGNRTTRLRFTARVRGRQPFPPQAAPPPVPVWLPSRPSAPQRWLAGFLRRGHLTNPVPIPGTGPPPPITAPPFSEVDRSAAVFGVGTFAN